VPRRARAGLLALALVATACAGDDEPAATTSTVPATTTTSDGPPATSAAESLVPLLLTAADLPDGFAPSDDVDDTITAFCAGQDATAGLQASARELVGFTRTPPGASVIQIALRFEDDGAAAFVAQAEDLLDGCSEVPDASGLAFTYEPLAPEVTAALVGTDASAGRYGTSIGSGNLTVDVVVLQQGDLGQLVAVLGLDQDRSTLDALAATAVRAAVERLPG
jgi:hypothetical protein